jgi:hypothetical protein
MDVDVDVDVGTPDVDVDVVVEGVVRLCNMVMRLSGSFC